MEFVEAAPPGPGKTPNYFREKWLSLIAGCASKFGYGSACGFRVWIGLLHCDSQLGQNIAVWKSGSLQHRLSAVRPKGLVECSFALQRPSVHGDRSVHGAKAILLVINLKMLHLTEGKHQLLTPCVDNFLLASFLYLQHHYPMLPCGLTTANKSHTPDWQMRAPL